MKKKRTPQAGKLSGGKQNENAGDSITVEIDKQFVESLSAVAEARRRFDSGEVTESDLRKAQENAIQVNCFPFPEIMRDVLREMPLPIERSGGGV